MDTSFAKIWLRLEGLAALVVASLLYQHFGLRWLWFGLLFFVPDLTIAGYLAGARIGAWIYNLAHSYATAGIVLGTGLVIELTGMHSPVLLSVGLIWCAHIGFDRMLGYGLKSPEGFGYTHLGKIGGNKSSTGSF